MEIQGKTAFVTGANRGIGQAIARTLVHNGAKVYAAARRPELIIDPGVIPLRLDLTDPASIAAAADLAADTQILVNNAGIRTATAPVLTASLAEARSVMEVNYLGTWAITQAFAPILARNGGGTVVNMLSAASWLSLEPAAGYSASKAAAWSLSNSLRLALRRQGTSVLGVHPWFVDTEFSKDVRQPKIQPEEVAAQVVEGLRTDAEEVLTDQYSKRIKAALPDDIAKLYSDN